MRFDIRNKIQNVNDKRKNGHEEKVSESMIMKTRKELKPKYE